MRRWRAEVGGWRETEFGEQPREWGESVGRRVESWRGAVVRAGKKIELNKDLKDIVLRVVSCSLL